MNRKLRRGVFRNSYRLLRDAPENKTTGGWTKYVCIFWKHLGLFLPNVEKGNNYFEFLNLFEPQEL